MSKRGLSEIIGYVLLISITLVIAILVFNWLRAYVAPVEEITCEDNVALVIKNYSYNCSTGILNLNLQNKGMFDIEGFTIKGSNLTQAKIGAFLFNKTGGKILANGVYAQNFNASKYCKDSSCSFLSDMKDSLRFIDIQAYKIKDGKTVYCKNVVVKQAIQCSGSSAPAGCLIQNGGVEICNNGVDEDCSGADLVICNCVPTTEICDNQDNDCDGTVDEGCTCANGETQQCGTDQGICEFGTQTCASWSWGACTGGVTAALQETCGNGLDDDCDGATDENCGTQCVYTSCSTSSGYKTKTTPTGCTIGYNATQVKCCIDDDGGFKPYDKVGLNGGWPLYYARPGRVETNVNWQTPWEDHCVDSDGSSAPGPYVKESWCNETAPGVPGQINANVTYCPNGCSNGECN
jgi:flagellin-like protein